MAFGGVILILALVLLILYLIHIFNKIFPEGEREKHNRREKNARKKRIQNYDDYHNSHIRAKENARHTNSLRNINGFGLVGKNSNASKIKDYL